MGEIKIFRNVINIRKVSEDQVKLCEEDLIKNNLYKFPRSL